MTEQLKPCPFCGGEARHMACKAGYFIDCVKCEASSELKCSKVSAAVVWNTRAKPKVKELEWVAITDDDCDFEAYGSGYRYWFKIDCGEIVVHRDYLEVDVAHSAEAAKAAAQADYEARILSTLA